MSIHALTSRKRAPLPEMEYDTAVAGMTEPSRAQEWECLVCRTGTTVKRNNYGERPECLREGVERRYVLTKRWCVGRTGKLRHDKHFHRRVFAIAV